MKENRTKSAGAKRAWGALVMGLLLGLVGLWLAGGGAWLVWLGGSAYYILAGLGCLLAAFFYLSRRATLGMLAYLLVFAGTCIWAVAEVGTQFWPLVPRIIGPAVFAAIALIHFAFTQGSRKLAGWGLTTAAVITAVVLGAKMTSLPETTGGSDIGTITAAAGDDWTAFGRTTLGSRFSPADQITPANVGALEVAWTLRTGDLPSAYEGQAYAHTFEATPVKIGDLVYVCTPHNIVLAANADTGKEIWRFDPKLELANPALLACRGVSYFEEENSSAECGKRIIYGTLDARLIALDALTGRPCPGFGEDGTVQLRDGLGIVKDGYYIVTSPPTIANGIAVVGGFVLDGQETEEPSGVIRGYDALTGKLAWSWDSGAREENWLPGEGEHYSRGSPNSWTVMSADPQLGLVYLPMGNATPDYVGMHRSAEDDRYSSSVVALDVRTGKRRWNFQTVHHDLWDYDLGSQPVLFDMPMPDGKTVPALAQPTKQGDIYILDRRTGKPLTAVVERPVQKGDIPTERYSPTQPVSTGFPSPLGKGRLEEKDMWGATPLDHLLCRIRFRTADYVGRYTPPSTRKTIQYPSNFGVMDWGSATIDLAGRALIVNSSHLPMEMQLIPQEQIKAEGAPTHNQYSPQRGTPYAANPVAMMSPLGIPCNAPPWGKLTAIDLVTRTIKWQRPFGTTRDNAPFGIAVPGAPNIAGSMATGGGLLFIGAAIDDYLRAFDTKTGDELWRARLPAGGQAAPISYVSEKTGRQYVVIAAGGHQLLGTRLGDYLIAYALPERSH
ncbi:MAG: membrane-bound PQQ-dependent dehydrogenase, glucose/quinate/shikimate family [Novosphingobium sp.]